MTINATDTKTLIANICAKATGTHEPDYSELTAKANRLADYISEQLAHAAENMGQVDEDSVIDFGVTNKGNMVIFIDEDAATQMYGKTAELIGRPFTKSFFGNEEASQVVCDVLKEKLGGNKIRFVGRSDTAQLYCIMVIQTTDEKPVYGEKRRCIDGDWQSNVMINFTISCL